MLIDGAFLFVQCYVTLYESPIYGNFPMFDTLGFYIRITEADYKKLLRQGTMTARQNMKTDFLEFCYTNFKTSHSYDYQVQWRIDNKHYETSDKGKGCIQVTGEPYLRLEFSAPKILLGHNVDSIDQESMLEACLMVQNMFEAMTGVILPRPGEWFLYRMDICANYIFNSLSEVPAYIRYLQRLDYPRRLPSLYKDKGLYFASRHNTLKIYAKGPEFKAHDLCRFSQNKNTTDNALSLDGKLLQRRANNILRFEVELKNRLRYLIAQWEFKHETLILKFKHWPQFCDALEIIDGCKEMEMVMKKFLIGEETKVMRSDDVMQKLESIYGRRAARSYFATYVQLVTLGQAEVKRRVPKTTYYNACKAFRDCNISIIVSDVKIDENFKESTESGLFGRGFPSDFSLEMSSKNKYYQIPLNVAA